jgi:hypothetical protein
MFRSASSSRILVLPLLVAASVLLAVGCSSDDGGSPPSTPVNGSVAGSAPGTTSTVTDEERLARAKTVAVGFFEAQAVNAYDEGLGLSTDGAALTIEWARAVNSITAADDSGYQVPTVKAPNVRVQIDGLTADGSDRWNAEGFVELSFRPGPVVSTTSSTASSGAPTTQVAPQEAPATYVVDLVFSGDGDQLRLADYRLDDVPYPVSQLFDRFETPAASVADVEGTVTLGHRDLDGSVEYVAELTNGATAEATGRTSSFTVVPAGSAGTSTLAVDASTIDGTTFADPVPANGSAPALIVFPGAFPGSAGTLALTIESVETETTAAASPEDATLRWALSEFPELTPRPVGTVTTPTTSSTTSSTTTSSTSSTTVTTPTSTVASSTTEPTTSTPTSSATSTTTSISTSTTTTTEP